jgi:FKBP-type peptidyl-prolyl cis-trans isomerase FkpA
MLIFRIFFAFLHLKQIFTFLMKNFILLFALLIGISSCGKSDLITVEEYIKQKNLTVQQTPEGIFYIIETQGTGKKPLVNSDVKVNYKGYLTDETVFDQNINVEFNLSQVIPGWTRGMLVFSEGSKGKLFIPAKYAYGSQERTGIPANSDLIFDIELITVK